MYLLDRKQSFWFLGNEKLKVLLKDSPKLKILIKQQEDNVEAMRKFSGQFGIQIDCLQTVSKQLDEQKQQLTQIDSMVDSLLKQVEGRPIEELEKVLL